MANRGNKEDEAFVRATRRHRRARNPDARTVKRTLALSKGELAEATKAAERRGLSFSAYTRGALLTQIARES